MRSRDEGKIPNIIQQFSNDELLEVFRKMCVTRKFEENVKKVFDEGHIKCPIYLSLGQEAIAAALSVSYKEPFIFGQHRCHDLYLSYGGDKSALVDELLHRSTGCAKGMGGSASIHSPAIHMFGHSGLMGDQVPISVGFALGTQKRVLTVMGDASAEEDYVFGAMGYAAHKKLPILFVCFDNGLSILTKVETRRNWKIKDVARAFGMAAVDIADDPWLIMHHARQLQDKLPAFMNVHTARQVWHAGTGSDGEPEWNRFELVKQELKDNGLKKEIEQVEHEEERAIDELWKQRMAPIQKS